MHYDEDLMGRAGLKLNTNHGLWSWAARHACWTLNRYQASRGVTSFELVHGKPYEGVLVPFRCPVYAYSKPQSGKGNPKWRLAIFLGKTDAQDAYIVGDGTQVMLTRSLRRLNRPWSKYLAYYTNFVTQSWEYQVNFGGRVVPSKRAAGPLPIQMPMRALPDGVLFKHRDVEAEEVQNYAKSKEGREEHQRELEEARQDALPDLAAAEGLPPLEEVGEQAPRAPQRQEPSQGLQTPPAPAGQSGDEGPSMVEPLVVEPLPWDEEEPRRVLKKTPPPTTAARVQPLRQEGKTGGREEENQP